MVPGGCVSWRHSNLFQKFLCGKHAVAQGFFMRMRAVEVNASALMLKRDR